MAAQYYVQKSGDVLTKQDDLTVEKADALLEELFQHLRDLKDGLEDSQALASSMQGVRLRMSANSFQNVTRLIKELLGVDFVAWEKKQIDDEHLQEFLRSRAAQDNHSRREMVFAEEGEEFR
jgi:hypothetical protein